MILLIQKQIGGIIYTVFPDDLSLSQPHHDIRINQLKEAQQAVIDMPQSSKPNQTLHQQRHVRLIIPFCFEDSTRFSVLFVSEKLSYNVDDIFVLHRIKSQTADSLIVSQCESPPIRKRWTYDGSSFKNQRFVITFFSYQWSSIINI